jgi:YjbE family integral membrane protein
LYSRRICAVSANNDRRAAGRTEQNMSFSWDFMLRFLNITVIDLALSGDNAIVIGMAVATLPKERRNAAILIGGGLAIALRIVLTAVASYILLIPFLSAAGGLALVWVVYKLLRLDGGDEDPARTAGNFRQAIGLIIAADFMMSLDNVLAVAGSAHGNLVLLIAGLLISMPLLMVSGGFISTLMNKAKWLVYVGAAAISFTAVRMVFEDKMVASRLSVAPSLVVVISLAGAVVIPGAFAVLNLRLNRKAEEMEEKAKEAVRKVQGEIAATGANTAPDAE